jgi:hypothetical protein
VGSRAANRGKELAAIAAGRSDLTPTKGDRRFADPAWAGNPVLKRTMQAYLAANNTVGQLLSDAKLDWRDTERMQFVLDFVTEGLAPSNNPLVNPVGYKAAVDTGGRSVVRGLRHFVTDMRKAPRLPAMVEPDAFTLGETVAATAGSAVFRDEVFELIQYTAQTDTVWSVPLLMVPPVINKFYVLDISPGRSMVEYLLRRICGSCCPPAATSPRSSTHRGAIRRATASVRSTNQTRPRGWRRPRRTTTPGGQTSRPGSASAAAGRRPHLARSAAPA